MNTFNSYDVEVLVNSRPVKIYSHEGKLFVEARDGTEYSLKIRNKNYYKRLAVCSVDGINVISGNPAGKDDKVGYVINGLQSYEVKGFRTSNDSVNAFKFASKDKSYAAKSPQTGGDTTNCGVIGVRWFTENISSNLLGKLNAPIPWTPIPWGTPTPRNPYKHPQYPDRTDVWYSSSTNEATYANSERRLVASASLVVDEPVSCSSTSFDMGTEFSEKTLSDSVVETTFDASYMDAEIIIYYASRAVLEALGVPVEKAVKVSFPSAFPSRFCSPPKK